MKMASLWTPSLHLAKGLMICLSPRTSPPGAQSEDIQVLGPPPTDPPHLLDPVEIYLGSNLSPSARAGINLSMSPAHPTETEGAAVLRCVPQEALPPEDLTSPLRFGNLGIPGQSPRTQEGSCPGIANLSA